MTFLYLYYKYKNDINKNNYSNITEINKLKSKNFQKWNYKNE